MRLLRYGCLAVFLAPCAFSLLMLDGIFAYGIVRQIYSVTYSSVPGTIRHSQVEPSSANYALAVRYTYTVDGQEYTGTRYRYNAPSTSNVQALEQAASSFPVGSSVPVFYRSGNPSDAILDTGLQGLDLFVLMVLAPFNIALFGGFSLMVRGLKDPGDEVRTFERNGRTHVTLSSITPARAGFISVAVAAIVCSIGIGVFAGSHPPLPVPAVAWAFVVAVGVFATRWQRTRWEAGHYDLILDTRGQALSLPATHGRSQRLEVPWHQVESVTAELEVSKRRDSRSGGAISMTSKLTLHFTDAQGTYRSETVAKLMDPDRANALANWLRAACGLQRA